MTKSELLELKERLSKSKKYEMVDIIGTSTDKINLEVFSNDIVLEDNINDYSKKDSFLATSFFEDSCEQLIRLLSNYQIDFDSISVSILPLFFMDEEAVKLKVDEESDISKDMWSNFDFLYDKTALMFSFKALNNGEEVDYPLQLQKYLDNSLARQFFVSYKDFVEQMNNNGFDVKPLSFENLLALRLYGKDISLDLDFPNAKTNKIK